MNRKIKVAILYGGKSVEHNVSLKSAKNIYENLDKNRFEPVLIGIDQEGNWYYQPEFDPRIVSGQPLTIHLHQGKEIFYTIHSGMSLGLIDIIFPVLHGNDGEDGSIQGLFKTLNIPIVGTGVTGSAISMDKVIAKKLLRDAGIQVSRFRHYTYEQKRKINFKEVTDDLGIPLIIKPVASGSSVGVSKITNEDQFHQGIEDTFQYDNELLFEEFIYGREMECSVMGNQEPVSSLPGEIKVAAHHELYSFDAKYVDDKGASLEMPARVPDSLIPKIKETVIRAYITLKCEDYSRVDFFLTPDEKIIINEINTIPGFTSISMFPQLWKLSGISYPDLVTRLIDEAFKKHDRNERLKRIFETKF
jgi:D-alanine-D-alanine ligase